jgi:crotonobetainyl-CoA:carnitine CoA-transferase CaiB-like acyl-CoA transferase
VDPLGFQEVAAIVPESTAGKHCAFLDLGEPDGRARFVDLLRQADVLVHGYRPSALDRLGLDHHSLLEANPGLIISQHDAYGWSSHKAGQWTRRQVGGADLAL